MALSLYVFQFITAASLPWVATSIVVPNLSLDTLPIAYFGGNAKLRGEANLEMLAKMRMVMIEKWEGHCWTDCLAQGPGSLPCQASCDEEHDMVATLKAVKKLNPAVSGIFYLNTLLAFPYYSLNARYLEKDALTYDIKTQKPIVIRNDNGMEGINVFGFDKPLGQQLYVDTIKNLTATGFVDGFFGDKWNKGAVLQNGEWQICNKECGYVSEETAKAWNAGKAKVLAEVTQHCGDGPYWGNGDTFSLGPEPVSSNMNGWWNGKWRQITDPRDVIKKVQQELASHKYVTMGVGDQHWDTDPDSAEALQGQCVGDCLARVLLAIEEGVMLIANGWDESYDRPLGKPVGPAMFQNKILPATLIREFESGTKAVFTYHNDEKKGGTGEIWWGGVPPAPTPAPKLTCGDSQCGSSYLSDTTFGKNDVDVATVDSAQVCCDLCAAKDGCIEWAWHGSKDKACHMHGDGSQLKQQRGTTSGVMDASCHAVTLV